MLLFLASAELEVYSPLNEAHSEEKEAPSIVVSMAPTLPCALIQH